MYRNLKTIDVDIRKSKNGNSMLNLQNGNYEITNFSVIKTKEGYPKFHFYINNGEIEINLSEKASERILELMEEKNK